MLQAYLYVPTYSSINTFMAQPKLHPFNVFTGTRSGLHHLLRAPPVHARVSMACVWLIGNLDLIIRVLKV